MVLRRLSILLAVVLALGILALDQRSIPEVHLTEGERRFLEQHWQTPIMPQGEAPSGYSKQEASLLPEDCGACHSDQYREWQTSLHSKAMGPGVMGQTLVMEKQDPATARLCWSCHAPLSEQQPILLQRIDGEVQKWVRNPFFDPRLQRHGMTCAVCHVRAHRRFGPPRRTASKVGDGRIPHGGFVAETAFGKSAFCKGCHQFGEDGYALNGKLLENTYQEWLGSDYAAQGVHCQDCHMPNRRHLWRGIHDPEMTRKGVTITVTRERVGDRGGEPLEVVVTVANTGTGHHFPTYLTPRVLVIGEQLDGSGNVLKGSRQRGIIGWEVTLDLSQERFDTRIPSGASYRFRYTQPRQNGAKELRIYLRVEPDYFYERFFRAMLEGGSAGEGEALIRKAWENARNSPYQLFEERFSLP